jgi:hypothetical protein
MQMSYFWKRDLSIGSFGLTGMMTLSSGVLQVRSVVVCVSLNDGTTNCKKRTCFIARTFPSIENEGFSVYNLDISRNMYSRKRVVSRDHDTAVRRVVEIADGRDGVWLERAMED